MEQKNKRSSSGEKSLFSSSLNGMVWVILVISGLLMLFSLIPNLSSRHRYSKAEKLVDAGQYEQALDLFKELENLHYEDTDAYIHYCQARLYYAAGDLDAAADELIWAEFRSQSEKRAAVIQQFVDTVAAELNADSAG